MENKKQYECYLDDSAKIKDRIEDVISKMTLEEKVSRLLHNAPEIPRLKIPEYNSWNECLHGVARAGIATVFPQVIAMAATFDDEMIYKIAGAISDEARAKHHEFARRGDRGIYKGLTECAPNVNIFRDPRWGRGQETFGEDPYLTGRMGVAYIKGLQGADDRYLKTVPVVKHFAAHSGPEKDRHRFNAKVNKKDLAETYFYAFKRCVKEGKAASVMGAYNRINGEPCCANKTLIEDILRKQWGFNGYYQADYAAVDDILTGHKLTDTAEETAVWALESGCDLDCGFTYGSLVGAVEKGLISEDKIDNALGRVFEAFFRLGIMDSPENVPYANIPYDIVNCLEYKQMALDCARQSMVLLKNEGSVLPLKKDMGKIAVIGPNADEKKVLTANYNGTPSEYVTFLRGIRDKAGEGTQIIYAEGCDHASTVDEDTIGKADRGFAEAVAAAETADAAIVCLGLSPDIEGEESMQAQFAKQLKKIDTDVLKKHLHPGYIQYINNAAETSADDKDSLNLPGMQEKLLKKLHAAGTPVVLVLANGSPITINWAQDNVSAIIEAWYPGESGGTALADILFGDCNPSGRLPLTFVKSTENLPPFKVYAMQGRTYRYMQDEALYPFGYGLSYTDFQYSKLMLSKKNAVPGEKITLNVDVSNCGEIKGYEVVQIYKKHMDSSVSQVPVFELIDFRRIMLEPGQTATCGFEITPRKMGIINDDGACIVERGRIKLYAGGQLPDRRSAELTGKKVLETELELFGDTVEIDY